MPCCCSDPSYKAWLLKEKVLGHQKERAKRTVVYDDHADHFGNERNEWLDKKEQAETAEQQMVRNDELHHRPKIQLKFN
mgnify:CR=1 FL=1